MQSNSGARGRSTASTKNNEKDIRDAISTQLRLTRCATNSLWREFLWILSDKTSVHTASLFARLSSRGTTLEMM